MPREQLRLQEWQKADVDLFAKKQVLQWLALPFLVRGEYRLARILLQKDGPVVELLEIVLRQLASINQGQCQPLAQEGPKLLGQVQRKAGAPWSVLVQEADGGIEPDRLQG
jgi:hypothetical protein